MSGSERAALIADAAIALLAERGLRGLTHRAVDEAAGLPPGSTSNHARTRAALLAAALDRIAELEAGEYAPQPDGGSADPRGFLVAVVAGGLCEALGPRGRALTLARLELALEAGRRPELRARYDALGAGFRGMAERLLCAAGAAEPGWAAERLVAWCDGVLFHAVAGAGAERGRSEASLRQEVETMLTALLGA
ncbi:TetR/AcrR family transcriptional regulator [Phaeacidiphilus oryzae]|uniref:TetR/AcrR family transcriptional regulator n=1 Tax=Phaeacidiphilus oryzae TaxID=348818 RepID=UPI00056A2FB7|nr:TetR family transcriptional regulator [Phaeacidiphilus oryzae]